MSYAQNQVPNQPELIDLLKLWSKQIGLGLNCHHIGVIDSFDPVQQTAVIKVAYKQTYFRPQGTSGQYQPEQEDYPALGDVPVIFLGGGPGRLTFPVGEGDECLLLFNDRDIDDWFAGSTDSPNPSPRLHSISDAVALVGLRSLNSILSDFDPDRTVLAQGADARVFAADESAGLEFGEEGGRATVTAELAQLKKEDSEVTVKEKITIQNAAQNLKDLVDSLLTTLQQLTTELNTAFTAVSTLTVTCASPGSPSSPPINAASFITAASNISSIGSDLGDLSTDLGELLE